MDIERIELERMNQRLTQQDTIIKELNYKLQRLAENVVRQGNSIIALAEKVESNAKLLECLMIRLDESEQHRLN